ncbi:MAG: hypothetical protein AVDCRST_MAG45-1054 [uncultured Solirubrobacterales bacterium]|uniref:Uncharacterized protein n=1 Tax=uncultured Solirubrobacterales bacterium TaxID=768556 RepID=A0A6J4SII8_9ACTN|nr:MAG: hypothetical protein AVDCRST_MAG45-1054 [uncultured Solirubrobacterales bacterium]
MSSTFSLSLSGEMIGGSYYFLDLTVLGPQEDWEEPKGTRGRCARCGSGLLGVGRAAMGDLGAQQFVSADGYAANDRDEYAALSAVHR